MWQLMFHNMGKPRLVLLSMWVCLEKTGLDINFQFLEVVVLVEMVELLKNRWNHL
jgi:hypothetical protein